MPSEKKNTSKRKAAAPTASVTQASVSPGERIAKRIARAGLCSRRDAEKWIADGRVVLNGKRLSSPAVVVTERDRIEVDGKALPATEKTRLWLYNKPAGKVTTAKDPEGRPTVFDALPDNLPRVLSVGRLDINTEGLLLLTNDGGLSRALELPSTGWLRRYRVRAFGSVTQEQLDELKDGIAVDGVLYGAIDAELERQQGKNVWLTFAMREGKNREVKNVLSSLGLEVNRLIRISYGPFQLGDLAVGEVKEVRSRTLRDQLGAKLVEQSGANFDAPLRADPSSASQKQNSKRAASSKKKPQGKAKKDPLQRLTTSKPASPPRRTAKTANGRKRSNADRRR